MPFLSCFFSMFPLLAYSLNNINKIFETSLCEPYQMTCVECFSLPFMHCPPYIFLIEEVKTCASHCLLPLDLKYTCFTHCESGSGPSKRFSWPAVAGARQQEAQRRQCEGRTFVRVQVCSPSSLPHQVAAAEPSSCAFLSPLVGLAAPASALPTVFQIPLRFFLAKPLFIQSPVVFNFLILFYFKLPPFKLSCGFPPPWTQVLCSVNNEEVILVIHLQYLPSVQELYTTPSRIAYHEICHIQYMLPQCFLFILQNLKVSAH